jgi:hypothetical protein
MISGVRTSMVLRICTLPRRTMRITVLRPQDQSLSAFGLTAQMDYVLLEAYI